MTLDPRQAEAFLAVAELGSFELAATRLRVTASAVSQRVRALEISLGHPLLLRTRPCRATATGQRVLQYLRRQALLNADLQAEMSNTEDATLTISLAVNADSLASWFFPALAGMLVRERILLDLVVEDQDHTYALLESGMVIGCVSTEPQSMRGCSAELLGTMNYRLVGTAEFCKRWFPSGLTRQAARLAPVVAYTRKDTLHSTFLLERLGLPEGAYPCHYVPGTEAHLAAVRYGLGYAFVPAALISSPDSDLVDLAPKHPVAIDLYWHRWNVQSPRMDAISRQVMAAARATLSAPGNP